MDERLMSNINNFNNYVTDWAAELDATKKCPYAKPASDNDRIKKVVVSCTNCYEYWSAVYNEAEQFDDSTDVVMIAIPTDTELITNEQHNGGCDSFNGWCNCNSIDLWALNLYVEDWTIVLLQRLSVLDDASKVFEQQGHYEDYIPYLYNKFILTRRKLRRDLNDSK
jgi:hypothetical protein